MGSIPFMSKYGFARIFSDLYKMLWQIILQCFIPLHRAIVIKQIHSIYVALKFHGGGRVIKKNKYLKGSWEKGQ